MFVDGAAHGRALGAISLVVGPQRQLAGHGNLHALHIDLGDLLGILSEQGDVHELAHGVGVLLAVGAVGTGQQLVSGAADADTEAEPGLLFAVGREELGVIAGREPLQVERIGVILDGATDNVGQVGLLGSSSVRHSDVLLL